MVPVRWLAKILTMYISKFWPDIVCYLVDLSLSALFRTLDRTVTLVCESQTIFLNNLVLDCKLEAVWQHCKTDKSHKACLSITGADVYWPFIVRHQNYDVSMKQWESLASYNTKYIVIY